MAADRIVRATAALLFLGSAAVTIAWCSSMADMAGMDMPGGWTMSMTWMRMPGQGWARSAAGFVGMWAVMMVAMMLPSLMPALRGYRFTNAAGFAAAYFGVWILAGVVIYPVGLVYFAILPALKSGSLAQAILGGALFGFFTYITYDLTNQATLRNWTTQLTLIDAGWGTLLGAIAAAAGYWVTVKLAI